MRIVVDLQGAQSESHDRGIGRYSLALAQALVRNRGRHEIILALNGAFRERIDAIRAAFDRSLPQANIRVFEVAGGPHADVPGNEVSRRRSELIREAFLANLCPDVVLVTSLFEGYVDDAVVSIDRLSPATWPTAAILYDLIPLAMPDGVFVNASHKAWYEDKLSDFRRADSFLAISEHSRREGIELLGLPQERVTNISAAVDDRFRPREYAAADRQSRLSRHGIGRPFVLYIGGFDPRKNVARAVRAFGLLPVESRGEHQLVLAGRITDGERRVLQETAREAGLDANSCIFTGPVDDDALIGLYNLCTAFISPSLREGFGLPVLEAMACGAPAIAANASSIPEVVGLDAALFDPESEPDIARVLAKTLADAAFRQCLRDHGRKRARQFSWDDTAVRALATIESAAVHRLSRPIASAASRRRLAFVSPLPPEQTGIADYSADLLAALAAHYDVTLVVDQERVTIDGVGTTFAVKDSAWLPANFRAFDRVVYQMGNSPFHNYMRELVAEVPGVVVLHDFFLGELLSWVEQTGTAPGGWTRALYTSHGYAAVRDRQQAPAMTMKKYPANLDVVKAARGVIVHSEHARALASRWLGADVADRWRVIAQPRVMVDTSARAAAREALDLPLGSFVVASFGLIHPHKLNHRLIAAFCASALAGESSCYLLLAGNDHGGEYGARLLETARENGIEGRIRITGWLDRQQYEQCLAAADVAVQLRTASRGETSRSVLDCLSAGLPLVINGHGSLAEIDSDAVLMLGDQFIQRDLIGAIETLWRDTARRERLGRRAREVVVARHAPEKCAAEYVRAIEASYATVGDPLPALLDALVKHAPRLDEAEYRSLSKVIARSLPARTYSRQLLLDVTVTCRTPLRTGIERVARAMTLAFLESPPDGFRVEPVYLSDEGGAWHYRYARCFTLDLLNCPSHMLSDDVVEARAGDVLLVLDNSGTKLVEAKAAGLLADLRAVGISMYCTVYDLLPHRLPQHFPPGADQWHREWLGAVLDMDGALCISRTVAGEMRGWASTQRRPLNRPFRVGWFHLGADLDNAAPTQGMSDHAMRTLAAMRARPTFLMVGTIEPRKGYLQVIGAFDRLWDAGLDINLVIAGAEGWSDLPQDMCRTIPRIRARLQSHRALGKRLFGMGDVTDEYLQKIYAAASCLIAASEGEGFGLPLIEAARHGVPIIARDIPVFREIAGEHAYYFSGADPEAVAAAIKRWLALHHEGRHPKSDGMPWTTWKESADRVKRILFEDAWDDSAEPADTLPPSAAQSREWIP